MASDRTVVSFRLSPEEYSALEEAAGGAGESVSEFVRKAVTLRLGGGIPVRIMPNTSFAAPYIKTELSQTEQTAPVVISPATSSDLASLVQDDYLVQV